MSDSVNESEARVPVLGAIPLLGNLFKSRTGSRQKKNLLVFIRPNILRDADVTEDVSESKYNGARETERTLNRGKVTLLPGERQPLIPLIPKGYALPPASPPAITNPGGATPNPPPAQGAPAPSPSSGAPPAAPPGSVAPPIPAPSSGSPSP